MEFIQQDSHEIQSTHACIMLHGLGSDGHDMSNFTASVSLPEDTPISFFFPHAPTIPLSTNHNLPCSAWFDFDDRLSANLGQLSNSVNSVAALVEQLISQQGIAAKNILVGGFSQGGALALHVGLVMPKLAGVFAISSYFPNFAEAIATQTGANKNTPFLLMHGTKDDLVGCDYSELAQKALIENGYENVELKKYEDVEHTITPDEIKDFSSWMKNCFEAS